MLRARRRFLQQAIGAGGLLTAGAYVWRASPLQIVRRTAAALGSQVEIMVLDDDTTHAELAINAAFAAIDEVESVMSLYRPTSLLCELNRTGQLDAPHPWLREVLEHALALSIASRGAFDVTVQPLWQCWATAQRQGRTPTSIELDAARRLVDYRQLVVSPQGIRLARPNMQLTLNGIAQGFAADRAVAALGEHGIRHALVNTGEHRPLGTKSDSAAWSIGIQHPRELDAYVAIAELNDRALATSGDYASHFSADRQHHHIVDPHSGYSPSELSSVSVLAPTALQADALSTALFVLSVDAGAKLIASQPQIDALWVLKDGRSLSTRGFNQEVAS